MQYNAKIVEARAPSLAVGLAKSLETKDVLVEGDFKSVIAYMNNQENTAPWKSRQFLDS